MHTKQIELLKTKKQQLKRIHDEDDILIDSVKRQRADDPQVGYAIENAIRLKKLGENIGILPSTVFSGFGRKPLINLRHEKEEELSDPAYKLRKMVAQKYGRSSTSEHKKKLVGGFAFAPLLIPLLASAGGTLVGRIYHTIRDKLEGNGYKIKHKNLKEKRHFIHHLIKSM